LHNKYKIEIYLNLLFILKIDHYVLTQLKEKLIVMIMVSTHPIII